jgi:hypothetical protein
MRAPEFFRVLMEPVFRLPPGSRVRTAALKVDRGDVVIVLGRETIRGESSGLEVDRELAQLFRLRGAGVADQAKFRSWDEALQHGG